MKSRVLIVIRDYMKGLTKLKWMGRLLNKHNIEDALAEYSTMLDEAERGFQTATLIEIHLSVNMLQQQQRLIGSVSMPEPEPAPPASDESNLPIPPPYSLEGAHPVLSVDITTQEDGLARGRAEVASSETQTQTVSEIDELVKELRTIEKSGVGNVHSLLLWIQKFLNLCERDSSSDITNPTSDSKVRRIVQRGSGPIHPMLK